MALDVAGRVLALCAARLLLAQNCADRRLSARSPPHPLRQLLPVPRSRQRRAQGRAAPRPPRRGPPAALSGAPIVPGKSADSLLYQRISDPDPNLRMPPPTPTSELTPAQIAAAEALDRRGRPVEGALGLPPRRSSPAARRAGRRLGAATRSTASSWRGSKRRASRPAPEADRRTLIRRVALDLTGLPPTPAEVEAFLDDASPDAYESMRRPLPRLAALRRAPRPLLARRRPLRRHPRHPLRQLPRDLALPRLGHRRLQPQHAVRPVHHRAAGRRPAAQRARSTSSIATGFNRCNITTNEGGIDRRGVRSSIYAARPRRDRRRRSGWA